MTFFCPYCAVKLEKEIKRKSKCPQCDKFIFVRSGKAVTEEKAFIEDWKKYLNFIIPDVDGLEKKAEEELEKRFGKKPSPNDVVWAMFNKALLCAKNPDDTTVLYENMATFLESEGKPERAKEMRKLADKVWERAYKKELIPTSKEVLEGKRMSLESNQNGEFNCPSCGTNMGKPKIEKRMFGLITEKVLLCQRCGIRGKIGG